MNKKFDGYRSFFDEKLKSYLAVRFNESSDCQRFNESLEYSLYNGGKRFRPLLCFATGEALGLGKEQIFPMAAAVECIHTYSLIHDDLPCMDNDSERRGLPANHIKFGEGMALLSGDALLTEAFCILSEKLTASKGLIVSALARAAGSSGMICGQVLDMNFGKKIKNLDDLIHLHEQKTGQLIAFCLQAPAIFAEKKSKKYFELGLKAGLAFQVKDDLLDQDEDGELSFIHFLGVAETQIYLENLTEKISIDLKKMNLENSFLESLIHYNLNRQK